MEAVAGAPHDIVRLLGAAHDADYVGLRLEAVLADGRSGLTLRALLASRSAPLPAAAAAHAGACLLRALAHVRRPPRRAPRPEPVERDAPRRRQPVRRRLWRRADARARRARDDAVRHAGLCGAGGAAAERPRLRGRLLVVRRAALRARGGPRAVPPRGDRRRAPAPRRARRDAPPPRRRWRRHLRQRRPPRAPRARAGRASDRRGPGAMEWVRDAADGEEGRRQLREAVDAQAVAAGPQNPRKTTTTPRRQRGPRRSDLEMEERAQAAWGNEPGSRSGGGSSNQVRHQIWSINLDPIPAAAILSAKSRLA